MSKPSDITEEQIAVYEVYKTHDWETIKTNLYYKYSVQKCRGCGSFVAKGSGPKNCPDAYYSDYISLSTGEYGLENKIPLDVKDCTCNNLFIRYVIV